MRSYWFGPSQKCAMRALATLPPPLTTKVPWKLRRLAASWMRISQARTSRAGAGVAAAGLRRSRRAERKRRPGEGQGSDGTQEHGRARLSATPNRPSRCAGRPTARRAPSCRRTACARPDSGRAGRRGSALIGDHGIGGGCGVPPPADRGRPGRRGGWRQPPATLRRRVGQRASDRRRAVDACRTANVPATRTKPGGGTPRSRYIQRPACARPFAPRPRTPAFDGAAGASTTGSRAARAHRGAETARRAPGRRPGLPSAARRRSGARRASRDAPPRRRARPRRPPHRRRRRARRRPAPTGARAPSSSKVPIDITTLRLPSTTSAATPGSLTSARRRACPAAAAGAPRSPRAPGRSANARCRSGSSSARRFLRSSGLRSRAG